MEFTRMPRDLNFGASGDMFDILGPLGTLGKTSFDGLTGLTGYDNSVGEEIDGIDSDNSDNGADERHARKDTRTERTVRDPSVAKKGKVQDFSDAIATFDCQHNNWNYTSGLKTCVSCGVQEPCDHKDTTFELGHRVCCDCKIAFFGLELVNGPPTRAVYNRNLKTGKGQETAPIVTVGHNSDDPWNWKSYIATFTVEVELLEDKTFEVFDNSQGKFISGTCRYTLDQHAIDNPKNIIFKDIKVLHTSQQKKTTKSGRETKDNDFILQFTLTGNYFDGKTITFAVVRSTPFTVFSHSKQMKSEAEKSKCVPTLTKIIQQRTDLAINMDVAFFGTNFFADKIAVRVGGGGATGLNVPFSRHDNTSGWITLNQYVVTQLETRIRSKKETSFAIYLCNDGKEWVKTEMSLTFVNHAINDTNNAFFTNGPSGSNGNNTMGTTQTSLNNLTGDILSGLTTFTFDKIE